MIWLILLMTGWLMLAVVNDCYDIRVSSNHLQIVPRLLLTTIETGVMYLLLFFIFGRPADLLLVSQDQQLSFLNFFAAPRLMPALFLLVFLPTITFWRMSYIKLFTSASLRRRAIIVGAGQSGRALMRAVRQTLKDYEFIGFVDDDPAKQNTYIAGLPVLGNRDALLDLVQSRGADEVLLAISHELHRDLFKILIDCYEHGVEIKPMSLLYEEAMGRVPVEHLEPHWFLHLSSANWPTLNRIFKRLTDILAALLGLAVLVVIFPVVALAIYLDSPGSIFYKQERVGQCGKVFWLMKFRSMIPDAEQQGKAIWAKQNDPRITRLGRFLRRTRLDELPQVINILKGDMSIVGPRPERPEFVAQLQEQIPFYRARLNAKPGLTGWAQVKYRYGSSAEDALVKLQYDLYYIKHQSMLLDLFIMLRTVGVVLMLRGT